MKPLVNPLFLFILLQIGCLIVLRYYCRVVWSRALKSVWLLLVLSLLGLGVLSIPLISRSFEYLLSVTANEREKETEAPAYIFVLGGGYLPGASLDQDALVAESTRRVLAAIVWWRQYPQAKLVFSGTEKNIKNRPKNCLTRLMAKTAVCHGVPESQLLLESNSINTREHPIKALQLSGITPETRIGLVTSGWHMRRAQREFCRYFSSVRIHPVPFSSYFLGWQDFIPNSDALEASTAFLQECVGIIWYAMLGNIR